MNDRPLDAVIRAALSPADDIRPPVGLPDEIHRRLLVTPQQTPALGTRFPKRGWIPASSPLALLLILLLALAGIAVGAALLLSEGPTTPDVLTFRGGHGRTGEMPGPGPVREPEPAWEAKLPRGLSASTMPLVWDGTVYVVDVRGDVLTYDLATGEPGWTFEIPADVNGTPLIAGGLLIVPADDGVVRAFDLRTGTPAWSKDVGARAGSPIGGWGDLALVGADDGYVHALEIASGEERWTVDAGGPVVKVPAIEDGIAYVVVNDGPVTAFDAATGESLWTAHEVGPGEYGTPAISDGSLYASTGSKAVASPSRWSPSTSALSARPHRASDGDGRHRKRFGSSLERSRPRRSTRSVPITTSMRSTRGPGTGGSSWRPAGPSAHRPWSPATSSMSRARMSSCTRSTGTRAICSGRCRSTGGQPLPSRPTADSSSGPSSASSSRSWSLPLLRRRAPPIRNRARFGDTGPQPDQHPGATRFLPARR